MSISVCLCVRLLYALYLLLYAMRRYFVFLSLAFNQSVSQSVNLAAFVCVCVCYLFHLPSHTKHLMAHWFADSLAHNVH